MTQVAFSDRYDDYGQPRLRGSIGVPRGRDPRVAAAVAESYLAFYEESEFARRDDATHYIVDRDARLTAYEAVNDGSMPLAGLLDAIRAGTVTRCLLRHSLVYYDGSAFIGLPLGQLGDFGAMTRALDLALTTEMLEDGYRSGAAVAVPPEIPPYLDPSGAPSWTGEYPADFRARLLPLAGYEFHPGGAGSEFEA